MTKGQYEPPDTLGPSPGGSDRFDSLFERARRDAFTPEESERLWQSLAAAGPTGGGGNEGLGGAARGGWASGALVKLGVPFLVVGGIVAGVYSTRAPALRGPIAATSAPAGIAQGSDAPPAQSGPPVVSWEDLPRAQELPQAVARSRKAEPVVGVAPLASPAPEPSAVGAPAEAELLVAPAAPAAPAAGPSEGALLLRARTEMASSPASALALTDEDANRFPSGALAPEREVLAIEALVRLGRGADAKSRFAAFRAQYPQSPHLARLASLVGP
jgi:hypothetical protein